MPDSFFTSASIVRPDTCGAWGDAAAVSPESSRIMAELGAGLCIIPQKPWDMVAQELATYRDVYRTVNGSDAPPPVLAGWTFCDEDPERARDGGALHRRVLAHRRGAL